MFILALAASVVPAVPAVASVAVQTVQAVQAVQTLPPIQTLSTVPATTAQVAINAFITAHAERLERFTGHELTERKLTGRLDGKEILAPIGQVSEPLGHFER